MPTPICRRLEEHFAFFAWVMAAVNPGIAMAAQERYDRHNHQHFHQRKASFARGG